MNNSELIRRLRHVIIGAFVRVPPAETGLLCNDQDQMAPVIVRQEAIFICPADNEADTHTGQKRGKRGTRETRGEERKREKRGTRGKGEMRGKRGTRGEKGDERE